MPLDDLRLGALIQNVVKDDEEGIGDGASGHSAWMWRESRLGHSEKGHQGGSVKVADTPNHEDAAVIESPSERLHICFFCISEVWRASHCLLRLRHGQCTTVKEVDFQVML